MPGERLDRLRVVLAVCARAARTEVLEVADRAPSGGPAGSTGARHLSLKWLRDSGRPVRVVQASPSSGGGGQVQVGRRARLGLAPRSERLRTRYEMRADLHLGLVRPARSVICCYGSEPHFEMISKGDAIFSVARMNRETGVHDGLPSMS